MRVPQPSMKPKPLNTRQKVALQLVLDGLPKNEICDRLGITPKTLWTWRRLPAWSETLDVALKEETNDGNTLVKSYYPMAVGILRKLALTGNDNVKLGAARTLLEAHISLCQREEQQAVIATLEEQLEELRVMAQAKTLAAAPEPAIEVEISPVANGSANTAAAAPDGGEL